MKRISREEISRELREMGSHLPDASGSPGFGVPDGYFDRLPSDISDRISAEKRGLQSPQAVVVRSPRRLALAMITGMVLLAFSLSLFLIDRGTDNGYLSEADYVWQKDYYTLYASMDPLYFYELILDESIEATEPSADIAEYDDAKNEAILQYLYNTSEYYSMPLEDLE